MIYDCFTYFNEIEILELRLNTLADHVDYFVIVEANQTHSGISRPFLFPEHRKAVSQFADKIIYVQVEDMPETNDPWVRENFQRNCILRGLESCKAEDIILISDADEIPKPEALAQLTTSPAGKKILAKNPVAFAQKNCLYFVNCVERRFWHGTVAIKFKNLRLPQTVRDNRERSPRIRDAGWHFTYLGGVSRVSEKLKSYAHQEFASWNLSDDYIQKAIESGISDIHDENSPRLRFVNLDETYPQYTAAWVTKYPALFFDATEKATANEAYPSIPDRLFYNFPRWYWFLFKQKLKSAF
jgi:beta-1,4-mannosyl-glycoprotein beta-1,4-N-acetylglucosaminyltransferase